MNINPDHNRRILVIDDNKAIHEDFRKILARPKAPSDNIDGRAKPSCSARPRRRSICQNLKSAPPFKARKA